MDQLLEVLGRSDVQTGIALGFVLGVGFQIVLSFLFSVFFPGSDKARIGSQASLVTKLQENGYSVYTPISTSCGVIIELVTMVIKLVTSGLSEDPKSLSHKVYQ